MPGCRQLSWSCLWLGGALVVNERLWMVDLTRLMQKPAWWQSDGRLIGHTLLMQATGYLDLEATSVPALTRPDDGFA